MSDHQPRRTRRRLNRALGATVTAATLFACVPTMAVAQTGSLDSPQWPDFYSAPADLTAMAPAAGDLIREAPLTVAGTVPGLGAPWQAAEARRIMYRSTGAAGLPVAVTGTYMRSSVPWAGATPRPIAALAPGTEGQGDQCAPSKSFQNALTVQTSPPSLGAGYELLLAWTLLSRGFDVVATDYEGLGTDGTHTYVDRASEGHAVLDSVRAAQRLPGSDVAPNAPVVFTGHSQGGGATASAAELRDSYAPELQAVGAVASAPPADLFATLDRVDGSAIAGVVGYAINGFTFSHPELAPLLDRFLGPRGKDVLHTLGTQCIADSILTFGLHHTGELTLDGRSAGDTLRGIPEAVSVIDAQRLGRIRPSFPVRVLGNINDDAVPYPQVRRMAQDWCGLGADVELLSEPLPPILPSAVIPNHMGPMLLHMQETGDYLLGRVNGVAAHNGCAELRA